MQRVLRPARRHLEPRRQLPTAFWRHGTSELELYDACQALLPVPVADSGGGRPQQKTDKDEPRVLAASSCLLGLLDFLYPKKSTRLLGMLLSAIPARHGRPAASLPRVDAPLHFSSESKKTFRGENFTDAPVDTATQFHGAMGDDVVGQGRPQDTFVFDADADADADALSRLLASNKPRDQDPGYFDRVWEVYQRAQGDSPRQQKTRVLLCLAQSDRPVEAARVAELFSSYDDQDWTSELVVAGVRAELILHRFQQAFHLTRKAFDEHGIAQPIDTLLAYALNYLSPHGFLQTWTPFSERIEELEKHIPLESLAIPFRDVAAVPEIGQILERLYAGPQRASEEGRRNGTPQSTDCESTDWDLMVGASGEGGGKEVLQPADWDLMVRASEEGQRKGGEREGTARSTDWDLMNHASEEGGEKTTPQQTTDWGLMIRRLDLFVRLLLVKSLRLLPCHDAAQLLKHANDAEAYEQLIQYSIQAGQTRLVKQLYDKYRRLPGVIVDQFILCLMVDVFYPHDATGMAKVRLDWERRPAEDDMSRKFYAKFMAFYAGRGDVASTREVWDKYRKAYPGRENGAEVDLSPLSSLIQVYARRGEVDECKSYVLQLQSNIEERLLREGASHYYDGEQRLLRSLTIAWNMLLNAHVRARDYDGALRHFYELHEAGRADAVSFGTIMGLTGSRGELQSTLELYEMARQSGIEPDLAIVDALVEAYCMNDQWSEAEQLCSQRLKKVALKGKQHTVLWNTLLSHHARRRDLETVNRLLERMAREQVPFDDKTYEHILEALVNCKQSHHAYHMIRVAVKERVFYPKVEHYILLMAAFIRTHEPNMVFDVNQMMTAAGMGQSAQRLSKLLDALGRWRELPAHLRAAGARGQYYVNLAMEEFAKAHRRESPILREDRRAWASLYARMTFILIQFRDLATTQQLIETFQTKMWGEAPPGRVAGLPKNLVHSILLADFYDGNYDAVQKTWDMLFARTRAQGRARLVAAATRPEKGDEDTTGQDQQQGGTVVKSYQYSLCTPLKTMQRLYLAQKDAWGLRHLFTDVQRAGFLIDSKNWNYHIQILARLKHWQEAFRVCEDKLMPQWTGWKTRRARQRVTTALPLAFRRLASVGSYLRPTSYTIMVLAREYIALQEMAPWSRDVARLLQDVRNQCPRVVGAMATMSSRIRIEDLDPAEPDFGAETTGEEDEGEEAAEAEDEEVSQSGDAQRARRELLAWQQQEERGQDEQRRRDQAQYAAAQMAFARAQERRSERRGRERAAAPAPSAQKEEE